MMITGHNLIGSTHSGSSKTVFIRSLQIKGLKKTCTFHEASGPEIDQAVEMGASAFHRYRFFTGQQKAAFLESIAAAIDEEKEELIAIAAQETHLSETRLRGEIQRTIFQARHFAQLLVEGSWVRAIIDTAQPQRQPLPKPDLRQCQVPIGAVAVFGASNFPFAFSVAGGDTVSAFAAGCPVIYKAHPGHPATSELTAELIRSAATKSGLPDGIFSMLQGESHETGRRLVVHPLIKAVAFTGSLTGGKAIFDYAAGREEPIPVFAEMGSVNPVFILPDMLQKNAAVLADKLAPSNLMGAGQFCTNPGLLIHITSDHFKSFETSFASHINKASGECMLTGSIHAGYSSKTKQLLSDRKLELISSGIRGQDEWSAVPYMFKTTAGTLMVHTELMDEVFGPASIHVEAGSREELLSVARNLKGQLTVSIWATEKDISEFGELFQLLELTAGRIIFNAVPTGVEVSHAMVHGGPYPATTDSKTTSVGSGAIYRFTRPVCYQGLPQPVLPEALRDKNSLNIWRMINGELTKKDAEPA